VIAEADARVAGRSAGRRTQARPPRDSAPHLSYIYGTAAPHCTARILHWFSAFERTQNLAKTPPLSLIPAQLIDEM
jgi:hypothetical protein